MSKETLCLRQLFDAESSTYSYVLWDLSSRQGVLIDPVQSQFERDRNLIEEWGVDLLYVLETHVHADHISAAGLFREHYACQTAYSEHAGVDCADIALRDQQVLAFGHQHITTMHTPGHTPGCMSYYCKPYVFTGDTLLIRGTGRSDFQGGNPEQLFQSITQKLYSLPNETILYPGHDYKGLGSSSIGEEKQFNARIPEQQNQSAFVALMNELDLPAPKNIQESVPANMRCGEKT